MKRNKFSLSNYKLATMSMGELVPIGLTEVLPGDTIQQATSALIRVSPLLAPVMHPVHVKIHHWFVPHRLIWSDWENFITGGPDGLNASTLPTITVNSGSGWAEGSLADYLGIPTGVDDLPVSALPFRGYAKIWNEYYRDPDLQTALTIDLTDGADTTTNTTLQNVCWEKDYLTTTRLTSQKGTSVSLPLGTRADVEGLGIGVSGGSPHATNASETVRYTSGQQTSQTGWNIEGISGAIGAGEAFGFMKEGDDGYPDIYADLTNATAATIIDLREAFALQRYKEARQRYGSRYVEYLRYLGVRSSDGRLDRPEYLGGGKQTIQFSEVIQQGVTTSGSTSGVGNLKGHGIGALRSNRYRKFFEEHGYIFTLMYVLPKTMYADGLQKHWSYSTKEDFFQKELQHVGQQEVLYKELRWAHATPNATAGYQDRYDQYRRIESSIAGEFRSTLSHWHYARLMASDPAINEDFVKAIPTKRVNADTSSDVLWVMANHNIQARRMLSKEGTPMGVL